MDEAGHAWVDDELAGCRLADERLTKRLRRLLEQIGRAVSASIPLACQDWANTKAAYRFFSNDRIDEAEILAGHFEATRSRFEASEGPVLVLQDTTEFTYQRENTAPVGLTKSINSGKDKAGRLRKHSVCGLLMHSSLVVTLDGLPLGLAAIKFARLGGYLARGQDPPPGNTVMWRGVTRLADIKLGVELAGGRLWVIESR